MPTDRENFECYGIGQSANIMGDTPVPSRANRYNDGVVETPLTRVRFRAPGMQCPLCGMNYGFDSLAHTEIARCKCD